MPAIRTLSSLPSRSTKNKSTSCGMTVSIAGPSSSGKSGSTAVNWAPITLPSKSKSAQKILTTSTKGVSKSVGVKKEVNIGPAHPENPFRLPKDTTVTEFQKKVYNLLLQIPPGKISTYAYLSNALGSSPRGVGTALRSNPYAPEVPCHRIIATTGYIGGFKGDWNDAPSGINIDKKLELLKDEGVEFDEKGFIQDKKRIWNGFDV